MCIGTASFGIAYQQHFFAPVVLATVGCLFSGFGYGYIIRSFYLILAKYVDLKLGITCVAVSIVAEILLAALFNSILTHPVQVAIGISMPPMACLLLIALSILIKAPVRDEPKLSGKQERYQTSVLVVVVFCMLVVRAITTIGIWGGVRVDLSESVNDALINASAACLFFGTIAYFALIRRSDAPLEARYQLPLFILLTSCIVYLVENWALPFSDFPIERLTVEAIELFAHLVLWTVVMASIKHLRFSPYRILGLTAILYGALAFVWMLVFERSTNTIAVLVLIVVYAVALFLIVAPLKARDTTSAHTSKANDVVATLAGQYRLTKRESEILTLLLHGRNRPYIRQKLKLADGTVKSHTTHIYAKLGIHSRQELLDLVEKTVL
jgi:DNA-binding CsgD family transcriptional regulator